MISFLQRYAEKIISLIVPFIAWALALWIRARPKPECANRRVVPVLPQRVFQHHRKRGQRPGGGRDYVEPEPGHRLGPFVVCIARR